jgi:hypothetical protein
MAKVEAPVSDVPASYQQANIFGAIANMQPWVRSGPADGPAWNSAATAEIWAMTYVTRIFGDDTYRGWFEFADGDRILRLTFRNPKDIKFVATRHGERTAAEWRDHILATPAPLEWDCFCFGIIQREDHFTFYMSVDHLHVDAMFMGLAFVEIHMMYAALVGGGAPIPLPEAGSYDDYCLRQRQFTSALTLESPQVRKWINFAKGNNGTLPLFSLPLGDPSVPCEGDLLTIQLMDETQSDRFESACTAAGARFIGGVFAAAALAEHGLTRAEAYYLIPRTASRSTTSFAETARVAQDSFD